MAKHLKFTEEQFLALIHKKEKSSKEVANPSVISLDEPPLTSKKTKKEKETKRLGVKETPILDSIASSKVISEHSQDHVTLAFLGARLFSLNEIFALLQYRSYIIFKYKKMWHEKIYQALAKIPPEDRPFFDQPCKIIVYRQSSKLMDRDSVTVCFKYIIDALKYHETKNPYGILAEDDPLIVYEDVKYQNKGTHQVGIRIERIMDVQEQTFTLNNLFNDEKKLES